MAHRLPPSALALLVLALTVAWIGVQLRRGLARRQAARQHGCLPASACNREPFLGLDIIPSTLRALRQHRILQRVCELFREYGSTFTLQELHRAEILTIEPDNIKTVLSLKFHDYGVAHRLHAFKPLLGEGIFDTDGQDWASSRALLRPSFARHKVANLDSFETLFQDLVSLLPRDGRTVVDLQELFFRYTLDSTTHFLFGQSVGTLKPLQPEQDFAQAFHYAQEAVLTRGSLGILSKVIPDRKADRSNRICRGFAQQFVDEAFVANQAAEKSNAQQRLPNLARELASRTSDRHRVLDEVMNVLLAGRDTTASMLSNLFFMLAKRPEIWSKLRREVSRLHGRPPNYEELRELKYVQCCLNESLRLHPVAPRNERVAIRDSVLPVGGGQDRLSPVFVPAGTIVCYNVYAMHRRVDIYGSDADEFRPERWEDEKLQPRWGYLPFNGGPRICIGQRFALTEVGYLLVRMAQEYIYLESCDPNAWEESLTLTLASRNGTKVALTAHTNSSEEQQDSMHQRRAVLSA